MNKDSQACYQIKSQLNKHLIYSYKLYTMIYFFKKINNNYLTLHEVKDHSL